MSFEYFNIKRPRFEFDVTGLKSDLLPRFNQAVTYTKKENSDSMAVGGSVVTRRRLRTGRRHRDSIYSLKKDIIGTGDEYVMRWQATTPSYLGPGYFYLGWSTNSAAPTDQFVPIHFMSLTNNTFGLANTAKGCFLNGMNRLYFQTTTGNFGYSPLQCQTSNGSIDANGNWQADQGILPSVRNGRIFHKYSQVKINLYGTYTVPINYKVMLVQFKQEQDITAFPQGSYPITAGSECANMLKDWFKSLTYSTVGNNNGRQDWVKDVRVIKQFNTTIQPLNYSDQLAERTLDQGSNQSITPHIRELRWFIRHDRFRNYKWSQNNNESTIDNSLGIGWDVNTPAGTMSDCEWGKKVFLVVMASSPLNAQRASNQLQDQNDTNCQGSYDICVRNAFRVFPG